MGYIFQPFFGSNQSVTASGTSAAITLDSRTNVIRVVNTGSTNVAHVRVGATPQTATAADLVILPNSEFIFRRAESDVSLAYISASGTTLQVMTGTIYTA